MIDYDKCLKNNTTVRFNVDGIEREGVIVGVSAELLDMVMYIVKTDAYNDIYPYDCVTIPSGCITKIF